MRRSELVELAIQDLISRRGRWTVAMLFITIMLVSAACLASYGTIYGQHNVEKNRMDAEAWALVLRVGNNLATRNQITLSTVEQIRQRVSVLFPDPDAIRGIYPYRSCRDRMESFLAGDRPISLIGRTVYFEDGASDLFLQGHALRPGSKTFVDGTTEGLLVTDSAFQRLGFSPDATLPQTVQVVVGARALRKVRIIGVFEHNLPDLYDFVLTEPYYGKLLEIEQQEQRFDHILSGDLPKSWQGISWCSLSEKLTEQLQTIEDRAGRLFLQATTIQKDDGSLSSSYTRTEWDQIVNEIADVANARTGEDSASFREWDDDSQSAAATPRRNYDLVNVYLSKARYMEPAGKICDEIVTVQGEGTVNNDVIRRLQSIDAGFRSAVQALTVQQGIIVMLALVCLASLQFYRAIEKTPEIGMLRAMGMRRRDVGLFVGVQSLALAFVGSAIGLLAGALCIVAIAFHSYETPEQISAGINFPWVLPLAILLAAVAMNGLSGWLSSWRWMTKDPAALLN